MKVTFWGVRGSIPAPGPGTVEFGGNTTCVEVSCGDHQIIFDAGTGIRMLGQQMMGRSQQNSAHLFITHMHWDHIQGLPFFQPAFRKGFQLDIYGPHRRGLTVKEMLEHQMTYPFFPITMEAFEADLRIHNLGRNDVVKAGPCSVDSITLNHPDGVLAYRVNYGGQSLVFATDTEHYSVVDPQLKRFAEGADVLIYDAQYTPEEYCGAAGFPRVGWDHSTITAAADLARAANVGRLVLFHHDPDHDDATIRLMVDRTRALFPRTIAAKEGLTMSVAMEEERERDISAA